MVLIIQVWLYSEFEVEQLKLHIVSPMCTSGRCCFGKLRENSYSAVVEL